ncbi:hypothetical protein J5X84_27735 [Streptosporangiaceae bacterium NEAU-GS5]|nr:hypothetical protein [Streptosporangiaceae bacterium NEAU-GS5]
MNSTKDTLTSVLESAVWAPSVHNTQPWAFTLHGDEIELRMDTDRRLRVSDPTGRELVISCGAALFNLRLAVRRLGREPEVSLLPDPDRPAVLARVRLGGHHETDEHTRLLYAEIERRRTHRGAFTDAGVPERLVDAFVHQAPAEGARLIIVKPGADHRVIAGLTQAAQDRQTEDRLSSLELRRWSTPPGSTRREGVGPGAYPAETERTSPHFAQRDFAQGHPWGMEPADSIQRSPGLVALLTTVSDGRPEWLAAGQALQRILLHASAYGVSAAFHTQALEFPHLRAFLREELCAGEHPQMIMRLGVALTEGISSRRPVPLEETGGLSGLE